MYRQDVVKSNMSTVLCQKLEQLSCEMTQFRRSTTDHIVVAGDKGFQLNETASSSLKERNNIHIRQCSVEEFGTRARFCCGFDGEDTECCTKSASLFQLTEVPSSGESRQGNQLSALNASPLPIAETPSMPLPTRLREASETPSPVLAALAAPTTRSSSAMSTSISPSAVTTVLEMADPDGTWTKDMTVTFGGNEDTLLVATDAPPMQLVNGPSASVTESTAPPSSSTAVQRPTESAAEDSRSGSNLSADSSTESAEYSQQLSRGAVVAVGVGVSLAGAGLVGLTVFIIARRRVYKKQEKKWREHMNAVRAPNGYPGLGGGLDPSTKWGPATRAAYTGLPMSHTRGSARSGILGQGTPAMQLSIATTQSTPLRPEMEGPSPVSEYLREMGWREGSSLDVPSVDSQSYYSRDSLRIQDADGRGVATFRSDIESPSARSPGLKPTASWLGRHSVYEMP